MKDICIVIVVLATIAHASANLSYNCMKCICEVEGCESKVGSCKLDVGSLSCGPYQIKEPYYNDCYKPGSGWKECTKSMACSETCVQKYMARYALNCKPNPTCETYARVHNGGPLGCRNLATMDYWNTVNACCQRKGGCEAEREL
jgi:hypothetical protein